MTYRSILCAVLFLHGFAHGSDSTLAADICVGTDAAQFQHSLAQASDSTLAADACLAKGDAQFLPKPKPKARDATNLGMATRSLTAQEARALGFDASRGELIYGTSPGDPAYEGGLRACNLMLKMNGYLIGDDGRMTYTVNSVKRGTKITIEAYRATAPVGQRCFTVTVVDDNNPFR